jgi:hypothetical protein
MISSVSASRRAAALLAVAAVLAAAPALAQPTPDDKAAAEALFEHAKVLMKEGRFAEACPKLEESQRLDAGVGTMLNLGDCYEKSGKTASAWAEFLDAAASARAAGQPEREKRARERAAVLEPRLNRLSITVAAEVPALEVQRDGVPVQKALWGTPVPLDPGDHNVVAAAPGKKAWSKLVHLDPADLTPVSVVVPALEDAPPPPRSAEPPPPPLPTLPPNSAGASSPNQPSSPPIQPPRPPPHEPPLRAGQVIGYTAFGLGLAGGAVGGILGTLALMRNSDAALGLATGTNIALIAGGATFATGIVVLIATRPPSAATDRQVMRMRIEPLAGPGTGGVSVKGSF